MSSYYNDLPSEILQKLLNLELELNDGDITPKGFNKKKNQLLETHYAKNTIPEYQPLPAIAINMAQKPDSIEPSAADAKDFLDFLPSPTHSPKDTSYMKHASQHYKRDKTQVNINTSSIADPYTQHDASKNNPLTPIPISLMHSRSSPFDSRPDMIYTPSDSEISKSDHARQPSIKSAPSGRSVNSVNRLMGRSRYRESDMASSFKAIAPPPQPFHDAISMGTQMAPLTIDRHIDKSQFRHLGECLQSQATNTADAFILGETRLSYKTLNEKAACIAHQLNARRVALVYRTSEILHLIPALMGCFLAGIPAVPIHHHDRAEVLFILNIMDIDLIMTTSNHPSMNFPPHISIWKTDIMMDREIDGLLDMVPELAYIEFTKANDGELKGVTVSHVSMMEQCAAIHASFNDKDERILSHYDPRKQVGLVLSILYPIYAGSTVVFVGQESTPARWIQLVSKYKVTMALTDYSNMRSATRFFEQHPQDSKKATLSSLCHLIIDTSTIQSSLNVHITEALLRPLGCAENVIRPILSLPEYGGRIICIHEDVFQCFLDTRTLISSKVKVLDGQGTLIEASGFCMPNATVAIVDPDTTALCTPDTLGEVWVDSHATDEFWGLTQHTELIFRARPIMLAPDHPPQLYPGSFLRTGLCGTMIEGRLFIMGSYEDRIRQKLDREEDVFFSGAILDTMSRIVQVDQCAVFEILVGDQHLPIVICESDEPLLDIKAKQINNMLVDLHGLHPFCIAFVKPNTLARIEGRIHTLLVKRHFVQGRLFIQYLKINIFNMACEDRRKEILAYERGVQHTSMEMAKVVLDERSHTDMSRFTNVLEILQWRASVYPQDVAFILHPSKKWTWKKTCTKVATMARYLSKKGVQHGNKVLVSVPFGLDYLLAIYGLLAVGAIPVPVEPVPESVQLLVDVCRDLAVSYILIGKDDVFKSALKHKDAKLPKMINTASMRFGKDESVCPPKGGGSDAVILIHHSPAGHRYYSYIGHDVLMNRCRTLKTTCQMRWHRGIAASGLGAYDSLGFIYALFCGVYVGCTAVYLPTQMFYTNPALLFECFQRYKVKDAFVTSMLLQYSMSRMQPKDALKLNGLQNMMLVTDARPKPLFYHHIVNHFARYQLEQHSLNTTYANVGNPMITTRSYMQIDPITLSLDPQWLKYGVISVLPPTEERYGVLLHDSGMVPSNTAITIVNPKTHTLSPPHMMGEIWVMSDNNAHMLYSKDDSLIRCGATIADTPAKYMRTGDYGFLWSIQRESTSLTMEHGQCLFVLGPMNETLCKDGLVHFPFDIEVSIERCHPTIPSGGSVVFQTDTGAMVAVVAVKMTDYALSIVPALVSAIVERHGLLMDVIAVVYPYVLARSRHGEKRRRSIMQAYLASTLDTIYVKKMSDSERETLQACSP